MAQQRDARCDLCGVTVWKTYAAAVLDYITGETFDLLRCNRCGFIVTQPMPPDLAKYYPARYRTERQKQTGSWRVRQRATMLEKHFPPKFRGRILDLGCGTGAFAKEMQQRGWTVAVTELNDAVLTEMHAAGMEAKRPEDALANGFGHEFDAITAWHVLEHVPEPLKLAQWARRNLSQVGVFQATVPNVASWQADHFGKQWLHLDVPRHLFHFTPETLAMLVDKSDMKIIAQQTVAIEYDLFGVIQSALNFVCSKPNVLFERLTAKEDAPPASARDVRLSYALGAPLGAIGIAHCAIAGLFGKGATLTASCRPRSH
jgi:SAM-dependent methyltransferase